MEGGKKKNSPRNTKSQSFENEVHVAISTEEILIFVDLSEFSFSLSSTEGAVTVP